MLGLGINFQTCGQMTWKTEETDRGLEADLSYYFDPEKMRVAREAAARKSKDLADYPAPDLAIEIDVSSPQVDRPGIYAALRVVEVWRFDGETVVIEHLQPDGTYAPAAASRFLPIGPADIRRWLVEEDSSHLLTWERRLNQWAMGLAGQARVGWVKPTGAGLSSVGFTHPTASRPVALGALRQQPVQLGDADDVLRESPLAPLLHPAEVLQRRIAPTVLQRLEAEIAVGLARLIRRPRPRPAARPRRARPAGA